MAVPKDRLMTRLLWTKEFTSDEVENYIKRMLRECSIYESKPNCFNIV